MEIECLFCNSLIDVSGIGRNERVRCPICAALFLYARQELVEVTVHQQGGGRWGFSKTFIDNEDGRRRWVTRSK